MTLTVFWFSTIQNRRKSLSCHGKSFFKAQITKESFGEPISEWFLLGDTVRNAKRAGYRHLAHLGSQSQRRIWFMLPVTGLAI